MAKPIKAPKDKDGNQKWIAPVRDPKTWQRTSATVVGYDNAKALIRSSEEAYAKSRDGTSGELLSVSCKRYLKMVEARHGDDRTLPGLAKRERWQAIEVCINSHIIQFFGEVETRNIEVQDIFEFFNHLLDKAGKNLSLVTAKKVMTTLNQTLKVALSRQVINVNPMDDFDPFYTAKFLKEHRPEPREAMPLIEVRLLLSQTTGIERLIVWVLLLLGLRSAEIIGLRWRHVEEDGVWIFEAGAGYTIESELKIMRSRTKTHAGARFIPMTPKLRNELAKAREAIKDYSPDQHVFLTREGRPFSYNGLSKRIRSIQNALHGRPRAAYYTDLNSRNHEFRHTCVAIWLAAGISFLNISKWIGHADPSTTISDYGHLLRDPALPSF